MKKTLNDIESMDSKGRSVLNTIADVGEIRRHELTDQGLAIVDTLVRDEFVINTGECYLVNVDNMDEAILHLLDEGERL